VLLASLPASKTIEQTAVELFTQKRIGARKQRRGILYLYSARKNLLKIEVSYALEGDIPDVYCHRLEEAARSYMLSEIPQDFISELDHHTICRGVGATRGSTHWSSRNGSPATSSRASRSPRARLRQTLAEYDAAIRRLPQTQLRELTAPASDVQCLRRTLSCIPGGRDR